MAGVSSSSRSLRRRANKNFSFSSKISKHVKKYEHNFQSFSHSIADLDSCHLVELHESAYCDVCTKLAKKNVNARYSCASCDIICCPECYDFHHREKMLQAMRALRTHCPGNFDITISENGEFSASVPNNDADSVLKYDNLSPALNCLEKEFNAKTEVKLSLDGKLSCLYIQDKQMEDFFCCYPEYVLIDVTCEIVDLGLTLYLFVSEDSNGHCEIIAACMLKNEEKDCFSWMCETFKTRNPCWSKVRIILADSQIHNEEVFRKSFPASEILFSFFHVMQSFKKELSNLEVSKKDITDAVKLFENMITCNTEAEYDKLHQEFRQLYAPLVLCFENTWHKKRSMWVLAMKFGCRGVFNPLNKFLWQTRKRIKNALNTKTELEKIITTFFTMVFIFRKENYQKISNVFQTMKVPCNVKMPLHKYANFLTHYACKLVMHQLDNISAVKNIRKVSTGKYKIGGFVNPVNVTTTCCSCDFNVLISLPCCHIFAVRKLLSLPLFWETLCSTRWTAKIYQNTFLVLHSQFIKEGDFHFDKSLTDQQFKSCFDDVGQLLPLLTQASNDVASQRCSIVYYMLEAWKYNIKVNIKVIESTFDTERDLQLDPDYSIDHLKNMYGVSADEPFHSDDNFSSVSLCSEDSGDELLKCIADNT